MFKVGPNPYGLCYTLGIQGNLAKPKDALWFLGLAESSNSRSIEFHFHHLNCLEQNQLSEVRSRMIAANIEAVISGPWPIVRLHEAFETARRLGVTILRTHLSPVLCGARAAQESNWQTILDGIRTQLPTVGKQCQHAGLKLAIENHQDFGSQELLDFCELGGPAIGICLDTGNPLAVAEEPLEFAKAVAPKVIHVHLKDYQAQPTNEGYRLVRCAIGDGAIPFLEVQNILSRSSDSLTATLEPGALESRHIRLLCDDWWIGYQQKSKDRVESCMTAVRKNALPAGCDARTPAERGEDAETVSQFELSQMNKSIANMKNLGWLAP